MDLLRNAVTGIFTLSETLWHQYGPSPKCLNMCNDLLRNAVASVWTFSEVGMSSCTIKTKALSILEHCPQNLYPMFLFTPKDTPRGQERFFVINICLCTVTTRDEADKSAQSEYSYSVSLLQINKLLW